MITRFPGRDGLGRGSIYTLVWQGLGPLRKKGEETHKHGFCSCVFVLASIAPLVTCQQQADVGQSIVNGGSSVERKLLVKDV